MNEIKQMNGRKVLVIDDSQMIIDVMNKFLSLKGYIVFTALNGNEGLKKYEQTKPDIVITDLKMPKTNGFEVLSYIEKSNPDIPVIIISGQGEINDVIEALHLGAWDFITKPIEDLNIIHYTIINALEKSDLIKKNRIYEKNLEDLVHSRTKELQQVNSQLELTLTAIVNSLATITEKKDQYTAGHQQRVSMIAVNIAEEMGLTKDTIAGIKIAALLHDIGKIYVPAEILTKPAKLDHYEYEIIKEHSRIGYDIIKDIPFPWPIANIILQHHERIDGSGYPNNLTEKDILIEAKIIAVADVIEAMSYHRPYRPSLGLKNAIKEITDNKEKFYSEDCVDAYLRYYNKEQKVKINFF